MLNLIKRTVESVSGCHIYRHSLPHGTELSADIHKALGRENIKTVFDVGANIGQSALDYLEYFPSAQIYSFEPVRSIYQELVKATQAHPRIHPFHCGMARNPGSAAIHVTSIGRTSSLVHSREGDTTETIELDTITGFVKKQQLATIDFLKVDTEGYDLEVLAGAEALLRQQNIHLILVECEPMALTRYFVAFPALAEFLKGFGYQLFGIYEQQPHWDGKRSILYFNALFICDKLIAPENRL